MADSSDFTSGEIAAGSKDPDPAGASPASATQERPDQADAGTTVQPGAAEKQTDPDRYKGWIPPDAHERVTRGFHERLDKVSWATGLDRAEVEEALAIRRQLAQRQNASAEPQPDAKDEQGQLYYTPQQAAKWAKWQAEQIVDQRMSEIDKRLAPIESTNASNARAQAIVNDVERIASLPGYGDHEAEMAKYVADMNLRRHNGENIPILSAMDVYVAVVVPKLGDESIVRKKIFAEMYNTSTRANDDVNPAKRATGSRKADKDRSIRDLVDEEMSKASRAS